MQQLSEGLWRGVGRRPDDLAVWSMFTSESAIVAAIGLTPGRAHLGLPVTLANGKSHGRIADVSRNPGDWVDAIRATAEANGKHADRWSKAIRQELSNLADRHSWANPGDGFPLITLATTICWPGLLPSAKSGADLPSQLPKWSRELLSGPTINDGFIRVLGPRAASDVVVAGEACLQGEIDWWPLATMLAVSASASSVSAAILATPSPGPMPDDDEFALLRRHLGDAPAEVAAGLLANTASEVNGASRLLAGLERLPAGATLPARLVEVELAGLRPR